MMQAQGRIRFVTPAQRHRGEDQEVLAKRHVLYQQARHSHPHRWSGATRIGNLSAPSRATQVGSNRH